MPRQEYEQTGEGGFWNSLVRGKDQAQAMAYAFANAIGEATGVDILAEWGEEGVLRNLEEVLSNPPEVQSWDDVDGIGAFATYVMERVGEQLPQMGAQVAAYVAAAAVGKGAGVKVANKALSNNAALGKALKRKLGNEAFESFRNRAGEKAVGLMAAGAVGYSQAAGETQIGFMQEGVDAPVSALGIGVAKSLLDLYGFDRIMRASRATGMKPASVIQAASQIAKESGKASLAEGLTEATQAAIDQIALTGFTGENHIDGGELLESAIAGATVAGTLTTGLASADMAMKYRRSFEEQQIKADAALQEHEAILRDAIDPFPSQSRAPAGGATPPPEQLELGLQGGSGEAPGFQLDGGPAAPVSPEQSQQQMPLDLGEAPDQLDLDLSVLDQTRADADAESPIQPLNSDPTYGAELASEPYADLDAQLDAVADPTSSKTTVFVPLSNEEQISEDRISQLVDEAAQMAVSSDPDVQEGARHRMISSIMGTVGGQPGMVYTNDPAVLREVAVKTDISNEDAGRLLYNRPGGKADSDGTTIIARNAEGNVVADVASSPETLDRDIANAEAQKPRGGTVEITDAYASITERRRKAAADKQSRDALARRARNRGPANALGAALADKYSQYTHGRRARLLEDRIVQQGRIDKTQEADLNALNTGIEQASTMLKEGFNQKGLNAGQAREVGMQIRQWRAQRAAMLRPMEQLRAAHERQLRDDQAEGAMDSSENAQVLSQMLMDRSLSQEDLANLAAVAEAPELDDVGYGMLQDLMYRAHQTRAMPDAPEGDDAFSLDNVFDTPIKGEQYDTDYSTAMANTLQAERDAVVEAELLDDEGYAVYGDAVTGDFREGFSVTDATDERTKTRYTIPPGLNRESRRKDKSHLLPEEIKYGQGYEPNSGEAQRKRDEHRAQFPDSNTKIETIRLRRSDGSVREYNRLAHIAPMLASESYVEKGSDSRVPTSKWTGGPSFKYVDDKGVEKTARGGVAHPHGRSLDALITDKIIQAAGDGKNYNNRARVLTKQRYEEVADAIPETGDLADDRIREDGVHELATAYLGEKVADEYLDAITRASNATFKALDTNAPPTRVDLQKKVKRGGFNALTDGQKKAYAAGNFIWETPARPTVFSSKVITQLGMATIFNTGRAQNMTPGEAHLEGLTTGLIHLTERGYDLHVEGGPYTDSIRPNLKSKLLLRHGYLQDATNSAKDISVGDVYGMLGDRQSPEAHRAFRKDYEAYLKGKGPIPDPIRVHKGIILTRSGDWNALSKLQRNLQATEDMKALLYAQPGLAKRPKQQRLGVALNDQILQIRDSIAEQEAYLREKYPADPNWGIIDYGYGVHDGFRDGEGYVTDVDSSSPDYLETTHVIAEAKESRRLEAKGVGVFADPTGNKLPSGSERAQGTPNADGNIGNVSMTPGALKEFGPKLAHIAASMSRDLGVTQPIGIDVLGKLNMSEALVDKIDAVFADPDVYARIYTYDGAEGKRHTIVVRPSSDAKYSSYYTVAQTGASVAQMAAREQFSTMPKAVRTRVVKQYKQDIAKHPYANWVDPDFGIQNWMNDKLVERMRKPLVDPTSVPDRMFRNAAIDIRRSLDNIPPPPKRGAGDKYFTPKSISDMADTLSRDYANTVQPVQLVPYDPPDYATQLTVRESRTYESPRNESKSHAIYVQRQIEKVFKAARGDTQPLKGVRIRYARTVDEIPGGAYRDTDALYVPHETRPALDTVYIVTSNVENTKQALRALRHEILGHRTLHRDMTPDDRAEMLRRVTASDNIPGLEGIWKDVQAQYSDLTRMDQAEEAVARLAEKMVDIDQNDLIGQAKYAFRKLRDFIIKMLRKAGLLPEGAVTESEIRLLLGDVGRRAPINTIGRARRSVSATYRNYIRPIPSEIRASMDQIVVAYKQDDMFGEVVGDRPNASSRTIDAFMEALNQRARLSPVGFLASRQRNAWALNKTIGEMLYHRSQSDASHTSYTTGVSRETAAWGGQVDNIFKRYGEDEIKKAAEQLTQEVSYDMKSPLAKELTDLLDVFGDYITANVNGFEKIANYFPRLYDTQKMEQERRELATLMEEHAVKDPHAIIDKLVRADDDFTEDSVVTDHPGFAMFRTINNPKLIKAMAEAGYIRQDIQGGARQYIERVVRRAEMERVFGDDMPSNISGLPPEKVKEWNNMNLQERREEMHKAQEWREMSNADREKHPEAAPVFMDQAYSPVGKLRMLAGEMSERDRDKVMEAALGTMLTVPIDRNSFAYKAMRETMAFESLRTLLGSGLASIPEIAGVFARAKGSIGMTSFAKDMVDVVQGKGDADKWKELVEYMGVVRADTGAALATELTSETHTGPISRFLPHMFKLNGNDAIVRYSRTLALGIGSRFIDNQANIIESALTHIGLSNPDNASGGAPVSDLIDADGNLKQDIPGYDVASNKRVQDAFDWLNELGLDFGTLKTWNQAGSPRWSPMENTEVNDAAKKVHDGLNTFVNESIINPNAGELPGFTETIPGRMVFHLKAFMYSFSQNILGGLAREGARAAKRSMSAQEKAAYTLLSVGAVVPTIAVFLMLGGLTDELRRRIFSLGERGTLDAANSMSDLLSNWGSRAGFGSTPFYDVIDRPISSEGLAYQLGPTAHHIEQTIDMLTKDDPQIMRSILNSTPVISQLPTVRRTIYNFGNSEPLTQEEKEAIEREYEAVHKAKAA